MPELRTLEQAAEDVQYEIDMCFKAFELLRRYNSSQPMADGSCLDSHIDSRLFLEAFLLHFRCLVEFFYSFKNSGSGSQYRDAKSSDFLEPAPLREFANALVEHKDLIDKQLAHISRWRKPYVWDEERMARDLSSAWGAFIEALPDERKSLFRPVKV